MKESPRRGAVVRVAVQALAISAIVLLARLPASAIDATRTDDPRTTDAALLIGEGGHHWLRSMRVPRRSVVLRQNGGPQEPAIQTGGKFFRERCADCHGAEAKGDRGPDLTRLWTSPAADARAFQIIRSGVPGSIMPPSQAPDEEIRAVVAYLRSISTTAAVSGARGNVANGAVNGERTFWASCGGCHHVNDRGGRLGPDLSRIASSLSRDALVQSIREPSASIASGYEAVTLLTRDGQRIRGARKGEDPFSIQIMDTHERLQGYVKADLRDVSRDTQSLMPAFGVDRLSDRDLEDLLDFMATLRGNAAR